MFKLILQFICLTPLLGLSQEHDREAANSSRVSLISKHCAEEVLVREQPLPADDPTRLGCEALAFTAGLQNAQLLTDKQNVTSIDRKITCFRWTGYTIDYNHCKTGIALYNSILNAEKGMQLLQQQSLARKQQTIREETLRREAAGDGQVAAIDATNAHGEHVKSLNEQQRAAYATAVATLGTFTLSWPNPKKFCQDRPNKEECLLKVNRAYKYSKDEVIGNKPTQVMFIQAVAEFTQKGISAHIAASAFKRAENPNQADPFGEDGQPQLDRCIQFPSDPACRRPVSNQGGAGPGIEQVSWSFGGDGGNNEFRSAADPSSFGEEGVEGIGANGERIANLDSPFLDEAREASGILNPAAAASPGSGGGSGSPGAGGGGAGGGGGGGAGVLPGDLKGVADNEENKEAEIKSNKYTGKYTQGAGEGFKGIKEKKEEFKNPFDDLVKSRDVVGGVEEDRSIASDTGGPSDLFKKISRRYGMVFEDKRLEVSTLE